MISRTIFCPAHAPRMRSVRTAPMPSTSRSRSGCDSMTSKIVSPKAATSFFAKTGPMPRTRPDPR